MCLVSSNNTVAQKLKQEDWFSCIWPSGNKKSGAVFLYFDNLYSSILADNNVIYLPFVIIHGNVLKYIAVTAQIFYWKLCIISL